MGRISRRRRGERLREAGGRRRLSSLMIAVIVPVSQTTTLEEENPTLDQFQTKQKSRLMRNANPVTESSVALNGSVYGSASNPSIPRPLRAIATTDQHWKRFVRPRPVIPASRAQRSSHPSPRLSRPPQPLSTPSVHSHPPKAQEWI